MKKRVIIIATILLIIFVPYIKVEILTMLYGCTFIDNKGGVLANIELPEWTDDYPCTGNVNFSDSICFDAETMQLEVETLIECENSLPYVPLKIVFDVVYNEGGFYLGEYEIQYIE